MHHVAVVAEAFPKRRVGHFIGEHVDLRALCDCLPDMLNQLTGENVNRVELFGGRSAGADDQGQGTLDSRGINQKIGNPQEGPPHLPGQQPLPGHYREVAIRAVDLQP